MRLFPAQRAELFFRADNSQTDRTSPLAQIVAFVVALLKPRSCAERAEDDIVARYEGHAWCDSTERLLNHDIAADHRTGF
jgi:hypothetical protein